MPTETLRIRSSNNNKIFIDPTNITANGGLGYSRLIIPVRLDLNPLEESNKKICNYVILNVQCGLYFEENNLKISDSASGSFPYTVEHSHIDTTYNLEFPLDYNRIAKIEKKRNNNLKLQLNLRFIIGLYEENFINRFEDHSTQIKLEIPQSHWVDKILPLLSFGEYFILEIPKGYKKLEEAWNYIVKADNCYRMWDTKGAFANCREVGTLLDKMMKEKLANNPNIKKWKRSIDKFNYLSSLDLHTEDIKNEKPEGVINVNKNDTEHLLIVTKALLKYAEELLIENEIV